MFWNPAIYDLSMVQKHSISEFWEILDLREKFNLVTFDPLLCPNFMQEIRKILMAIFILYPATLGPFLELEFLFGKTLGSYSYPS